jgi:adenosylcobinamide-GDP ribazoletransferase
MSNPLRDFLAAQGFFTRLPVPQWVGGSTESLPRVAYYWPLLGIVVGLIGAAVTELAAWVLPLSLAVLLGMAATLLATGALHEDGLADSADGFGGGWDKARVLAIMKDSRIGSYGAIALGLVLLAKFNALLEIDAAFEPPSLAIALVAGHAASRLAALWPMRLLDYAREEGDEAARSRSVASRPNGLGLVFPLFCGLVPCLLLPAGDALAGVLAAVLTALAASAYFRRRIGGYTGDCLGATQQLCEVAFYLCLLCSSI